MRTRATPDGGLPVSEPLPPGVTWGLAWPGSEMAAIAEAAGASAFCAGEFADTNAYVTLADMARSTTAASIGTGMAYAFARSPFLHANALRQIHRMAPGRVFCGLGSGTRRMNEDWFGMPASRPLQRMTETVGALRAFLTAENGQRIRYDGELWRIDARVAAPVLGSIDVPIVLGAFNRGMLAVAGSVADGILGHDLFTDRWWAEVVDPTMTAAATAAGRDPTELHRWGRVVMAIDDEDPARATHDARMMTAFHLTVRTYRTLADWHGWGDVADEVAVAFRGGDLDAMAQAVPDDMVDAICVHGTSTQAAEMLRSRTHLPQRVFATPPSFMVSRRRHAAYERAIIGVLGT